MTEKGLCKCGHSEDYHNLGNKKLISGCNHIIDDDGESYGLCDCKKFSEEKELSGGKE
jgi:ferredoxin-thioredoxin reductase catalytic subunit